MATYTYDDTFIVNSVTTEKIDDAEVVALENLSKQSVTDPYYLEQMCLCLVYIDLAIKQSESPEMEDRVKLYTKRYNYFSNENKNIGSDSTVSSAQIGRG